MGIVFGVTGTKEPAFSLLKASPYEIRKIQSYVVAEIASGSSDVDMNKSFGILAKYIGVFGDPENTQSQSIAMTAPVITKPEKIAMTAPVVSGHEYMQFVLPFEYMTVDQVPKPTNSNIRIRAIPQRVVAVSRFSGWYNRDFVLRKLQELHRQLQKDNILSDVAEAGREESAADLSERLVWSVAQYHPPFTLPFLRRNEIWIELDQSQSRVLRSLIDEHHKKEFLEGDRDQK